MTIRNLVLFIQILGVVIMFIDMIFVMQQQPSPMQGHIIVLLFSTIIMFLGYYVEIMAQSEEAALLGAAISYIGKPFIMLASMMVICSFYNIKFNKYLYTLLCLICSLFFVVVYTTPQTHLYYDQITWNPDSLFSKLELTHGPLYNSYIILTVAFFLSCIVLIIKGYSRNRSQENGYYAFFLSLMVISGVTGYIIYLSGSSKGYDTTMFGVFGGVICLTILFFRYRIFDTLALAKDQALENSTTALIVLDQNKEVIYANHFGSQLIKHTLTKERLSRINEGVSRVPINDKIYNIARKDIVVRGEKTAVSYEIVDYTDTYNFQERLQSEVKERTEKIESIQRKVIGSFASIVEARSVETGEHIVRTTEYVRRIGYALKDLGMYTDTLSKEYIELLSETAPLHDVGKIAVPDHILNKPGKLGQEEFEEMKVHAEVGAKIIEQTMRGVESDEYVQLAYEVALYHHERWDGTGYPFNLKGHSIPLCARIMAVADTYDALRSERCYKPPFTKEQAIEIIRSESGTHFDPDIVKAFLLSLKN